MESIEGGPGDPETWRLGDLIHGVEPIHGGEATSGRELAYMVAWPP